jgi:glutamyl-tRNA synthetase
MVSGQPVLSAGGSGPATRLAPSPTGALHLGNARTFLVTWAMARREGWRLVLRLEDLDGPRVKPGSSRATVESLRWLGMEWDDGPLVQSEDLSPYRKAMGVLALAAAAYPSEHTRSEIDELAAGDAALSAPQEGAREAVFPASLRPAGLSGRAFDRVDVNWRFATPPGAVEFRDRFAGPQRFEPARSAGDFVIWTKRAQPAYQLAVVVDDHRQGITEVIRGDDLLESAARQLLLYRALGLGPGPRHTHLPLVRGQDGKRLAKRHGDTRVEQYRARGVCPEAVIGLIGWWCGIGTARRPLSAAEFLGRLDLDTIPRRDVTFTPEDDAWLLSQRA